MGRGTERPPVCRVSGHLLSLIHPHICPRKWESRRCPQACKSTGRNPPRTPSPRERAQKTVERLAVVPHPQSTDAKTEAPSRQMACSASHRELAFQGLSHHNACPLGPGTEPGARDVDGDKKKKKKTWNGHFAEAHHHRVEKAESTQVDKETNRITSVILHG